MFDFGFNLIITNPQTIDANAPTKNSKENICSI